MASFLKVVWAYNGIEFGGENLQYHKSERELGERRPNVSSLTIFSKYSRMFRARTYLKRALRCSYFHKLLVRQLHLIYRSALFVLPHDSHQWSLPNELCAYAENSDRWH